MEISPRFQPGETDNTTARESRRDDGTTVNTWTFGVAWSPQVIGRQTTVVPLGLHLATITPRPQVETWG